MTPEGTRGDWRDCAVTYRFTDEKPVRPVSPSTEGQSRLVCVSASNPSLTFGLRYRLVSIAPLPSAPSGTTGR